MAPSGLHQCLKQSHYSGFQPTKTSLQLQHDSPGIVTRPGSQVRPLYPALLPSVTGTGSQDTETLPSHRQPPSSVLLCQEQSLCSGSQLTHRTPQLQLPPEVLTHGGSQAHRLTGSQAWRLAGGTGSSQRQLGQLTPQITKWQERREHEHKQQKPILLGNIRTQFSHHRKPWIPKHTYKARFRFKFSSHEDDREF